jgi:quercetin dioxygenase-like cupin family protein
MATSTARSMRGNSGEFFVLLGLALCVLSFSSVVRCQDPDEVLDFCIAVGATSAPAPSNVWQTGTEEGSWDSPSDPSHMGVATVFNETTDSTFLCKDVNTVTAKDFVFQGLANAGTVTSKQGSLVTKAFVNEFPAVNTLGISAARIDFVKNGLNPPHEHPRATELLYVLSGSLLVGFVDTSNTLFQQTLETGDLFVFPEGLLHFEMEVGNGPASAFSAFDSQNPGTLQTVEALLGSNPQISKDVIESAFAINDNTFGALLSGFHHVSP